MQGYKVKNTRKLMKLVKPGDILLRRYDDYVSSLLIPGPWKHAGLMGNNGNVIHAIGEGVVLEDFIQFCRTDAICILRPKKISRETSQKIIERAESQLGKKYDYDFNLNNHKLYCSELIAFSYDPIIKIPSKITKLLGLIELPPAISPTDIFDSKLFEVIYNSDIK